MRQEIVALVLLVACAGQVPAQEAGVLSRIAFGSCANQNKPQPVWGPIVAAGPQLFLALGDNIYGDTKDMQVLKEKYNKLASVPGFQKLKTTCPILATWDDHDYGANDAGADYAMKQESQQLFLDFFGVPADSPRRKQAGIYHAATFGPPGKRVQVILLDTRYFRSPLTRRKLFAPGGPYEANSDPKSTLLGEAQWKWLETQLRQPAELRLLVSSIQVVAQDHGWEKWMNLPHERDRLYQLLRDTKAGGVLVLSGDRHLAELSVMDAGLGYPLYDLTSSGLTEAAKSWRRFETNSHRVATMNWGNNFGMVTIDWERSDPLLRLQIRDEVGDVMIQEKLPLSLLQPGYLAAREASVARLDGKPLTPEWIEKHLQQEVTLDMRVASTGMARGGEMIFLNSAKDFRSDENFTIVLDRKAQDSLKEKGVADVRSHFDGQAIRVVGTLSLYREKPQIIVSEAGKIRIAGK
jgi:alkaline phosphatase D